MRTSRTDFDATTDGKQNQRYFQPRECLAVIATPQILLKQGLWCCNVQSKNDGLRCCK